VTSTSKWSETRTEWIPIQDLTTDHDLAGFGPVESITYDAKSETYRVSNPYGCGRTYNNRTHVELYLGVFDLATGRKFSMSTAEYKAVIKAELAERRAARTRKNGS